MAFIYGIKFRLQLLLLSSIMLVLMVVGVALSHLIEQFHITTAQQQFGEVFATIDAELTLQETHLQNNVHILVQRDDLIAAVNMIHQYATVEDYQPLIYDVEKKRLADMLRNQARAGEVGQIAVYDGRGDLLAFFSAADAAVSGFVSWEAGAPVVYLRDEAGEGTWQRGVLPQTLELRRDADDMPAAMSYRRCLRGFVQETVQPVLRTYADGSRFTVGLVSATNFFRQDFATAMQQRSGVDFAVLFDDGARLGGLHTILVTQLDAVPLLRRAGETVRVDLAHDDYFLAARLLPLERQARAYLVAAVEKTVVQGEISRTQLALLGVLALSALVIMPVGTWLANRTISRPVDHLVDGAEAIERGDYGRRVEVASRDELGRLGRAFNGMADAVQSREQALRDSERLYRLLVDNLPQRVFYKDTELKEGLNKSFLDFSDHANRKVRFSICFIFQRVIVVEKWRHIPVPRKL
ncbi:MAG: HAMP domain-containing protein [Pseudomonadota bacterium]